MLRIVNLRKGFRNNLKKKSCLLSKLTYDHWTLLPMRGKVGILVSPERLHSGVLILSVSLYRPLFLQGVNCAFNNCIDQYIYVYIYVTLSNVFKKNAHIYSNLCSFEAVTWNGQPTTHPLATQRGSIPNWHRERKRVMRNRIVSGKRRTSQKFRNCYVNTTNVLYKDLCLKFFFCLNVSKHGCRIFSFQRWQTERKHDEIFTWR